jgi:membrane-associated phospholipid phosphatase
MQQKRKRLLRYVLSIITITFLLLTLLVILFPSSLVDREFTEEVQEHQYVVLDKAMELISWPGYMPNSLIMVVCASALFLLFKFKREALFTLFTLFSGVISSGLKILINRPRPTEDAVRILEKAKNQSFPSGHVMFYVIFFGFMILLMYHHKIINRLLKISVITISLFLILTIPLSRVYLGAHWFTDVVAAFLLGLVGLFVLGYFYLKGSKHTNSSGF